MGLIARKRERIAAQEKQELLDKQNKIGDDVYLAMKEAGDKNREYNKFSDGKINENLGPVMVGKIKVMGKITVLVLVYKLGKLHHGQTLLVQREVV